MKSKTFIGKDEADIERKLKAWISSHPSVIVKKRYPVENSARTANSVAMRVDYLD